MPTPRRQTTPGAAFADAALLAPTRVAPAFTLPDAGGQPWGLAAHVAAGPLVLIFYRGHWCPYCRRYLGKLQAHLRRFQEAGASLVAISPESPSHARALADQLQLQFPLLSDASGAVIDRYGVRNGFSSCRTLLPHPSVFVIDPAGFIRFASIDRNYRKRTTMRTILSALAALCEPPATA